MHDNDPETLEVEKKRNLSNTQHKTSTPHKSAPGWNENLASTSEASADRSARNSTTEDLQAETVEYVRARYTPDDRMEPTTAYYSRDEVAGPLGTALGHEDQDTTTVVKEVREKTTEIFRGKPTKNK
ncbi:hypothetical protein BDZ94DRAFT_1304772 [Collybia nuda]|uniref:Uncharacterized protein n=1 Tax=Collybia nuda TaxID=64659 RepID=A0A9P5YFN3_9AGAR|nr:hypothetical protein BDZ94DRAFT_1304772 [Collybia nuda]